MTCSFFPYTFTTQQTSKTYLKSQSPAVDCGHCASRVRARHCSPLGKTCGFNPRSPLRHNGNTSNNSGQRQRQEHPKNLCHLEAFPKHLPMFVHCGVMFIRCFAAVHLFCVSTANWNMIEAAPKRRKQLTIICHKLTINSDFKLNDINKVMTCHIVIIWMY